MAAAGAVPKIVSLVASANGGGLLALSELNELFSNTAQAPTGAGEPSRKDGRKSKDSRKGRQSTRNTTSTDDPMASYNITLDYSGKDGRGSVRKERDGKSNSSNRKKEQKGRKS